MILNIILNGYYYPHFNIFAAASIDDRYQALKMDSTDNSQFFVVNSVDSDHDDAG